jgi:hypothetical protein
VHDPTPDDNNPATTPNSTSERRHLAPVGDDGRAPVWVPDLWDARQLMATDFPAPKWAVPGIICEGLTLLAGPPKVGKSWLALDLALSVAGGEKAFGAIPVRPGPVLYLALEDTPRRLKSRVGTLLGDRDIPAGLDIATEWPTLPAGGATAIAAWCDAHPEARLVVIDVFAKVRGAVPQGMSAYDADYAAVGHAKRVADNYAIAIILVHHVRKAGSEDFLQEVSGTNGIAGAADATLVLKRARGQADGVLHVTGRDVEETEHALTIDTETRRWLRCERPAAEMQLSDSRAAILGYVRQHPGSTPREISGGTGIGYETAKKTCLRMLDDGQLRADTGGRYSAPGVPEHPELPGT